MTEDSSASVSETNPDPSSNSSDDTRLHSATETGAESNTSPHQANEQVLASNAKAIAQKSPEATTPLTTSAEMSLSGPDDDSELSENEPPVRIVPGPPALTQPGRTSANVVVLVAVVVLLAGLTLDDFWLTLAGSLVTTAISFRLVWPSLSAFLTEISSQQQALLIALPSSLLGLIGLMQISGINARILAWGRGIRWDVVGAIGDFLGAFGQIFIAILAVYVAWRQYIISRDLTLQQNRITQQQTIDAYFQGISDLVLDDEGLLEDWPQERAIAEARTAAILSSIDAFGKAKIIRFLSRSRLLTPLKRDTRLGRPILDGSGGYAEDRQHGTRVIDLGVMLAVSDLSCSDLRWSDLSDANLVRANLQRGDLVRANLARAILYEANLAGADLMGARLFYGALKTASPRSRTDLPNYATGAYTGAVVEGADFTGVQRLSETQRHYCCAWCGERSRTTIPGGCEEIPNLLGR
ncbi:MAG: pentapeptide repeat-containing protein [Leptolyngbyaceae cyanobacterium SM1_1_3]|nr:pentapeptide repeat-containing protein [Leptolyngbyaceae cyanobacterium SM1_1_3]